MRLPYVAFNEEDRVRALRDLRILDSVSEESFEGIVALASEICETPFAAISLVDADRQWMKASVGLDRRESPRKGSFCEHTIQAVDGFTIPDATKDARFSDSPWVVSAPALRFYTGRPLRTRDGHAIGALCVMDSRARRLSRRQNEALTRLANQVGALLELRASSMDYECEVALRTTVEADLQALGHAEQIARVEFEAARDAAAEARKIKANFLGRMSHELRTPLNAVIGFAKILERNTKGHLDEAELAFASRIHAKGKDLLQIVANVLELTEMDTLGTCTSLQKVDLASLMGECEDALRAGKPQTAGAVVLKCELPPLPMQPLVTDSGRLREILLNLGTNAVKFTQSGMVTIKAVADEHGHPIRVDIIDTGIGIRAENRAMIFRPFEQGDASIAGRFGGVGIGLTISQALADMLGFEITLKSRIGRGSTFSLHLQPRECRTDARAARALRMITSANACACDERRDTCCA